VLVRIFRNKDLAIKIIQRRADNVKEELLDSRFIHFAGHHSVKEQTVVVRAEDVAGSDLSQTRFVFLNGCHTALADGSRLSLAEAFIDAGAQDFAGFGLPVETAKAQDISVALWSLILKGESPLAAIQKVRRGIRETGSLDWLSLQHFASVSEIQKSGRLRMFSLAVAGILMFTTLCAFVVQGYFRKDPGSNLKSREVLRDETVNGGSQAGETRVKPRLESTVLDPMRNKKTQDTPIRRGESLVDSALEQHQVDPGSELGQIVVKFYEQPHPVYSQGRRLEIIKSVLGFDASEKMKTIRLLSEMAVQ
jgi:hypothetical protein